MTRALRSLLVLALLAGLLLAAACTTAPGPKGDTRADPWVIPADRYVFIDHHVSRNGEVVSGTCGGGMMIDFPMYSFDKEGGELSGMSAREITANESLKIVYGDGVSIGGALGGGASTYLTPAYSLPFEKGRVRITGVRADGLATIADGNETIALPAGETWTKTSSSITRDFSGSDGNCTLNITIRETLFNAGVLEKSKIRTDG